MAARRKPPARKPPARDTKPPARARRWSNNALVAAVVGAMAGAIVAGIISLLVTHYQDQSTASQARSGQQAQAAEQLETAANTLYQSTTSIRIFQQRCSGTRTTWSQCRTEALEVYPGYSPDLTTFAADSANVADSTAGELATQFRAESVGVVTATSAAQSGQMWNELVTTFPELTARCGKLAQEQ
jgi:hypothetical protein